MLLLIIKKKIAQDKKKKRENKRKTMIRDAAVRRDFRWIYYTALGGRGERERQTQCSKFRTHKWRMNEEEKGDVHRVPQESVRWEAI